MNNKINSYVSLHIAVFLYGFTGILGQVIALSAMHLILWRCVISSLLLAPFFFYKQLYKDLNRTSILIFSGIGILLGLHWLCFYGSIKMANASVAMICLSFISVMTVFSEALFNKQKIVKQDLFVGMMVIPGILLINQSLNPNFKMGFWLGILCSVLSAIVATLNKKYIKTANPISITWIEITVVAIIFGLMTWIGNLFFPTTNSYEIPTKSDWSYLLILSIFCTLIPLVLVIKSMHSLTAFSTMLVFKYGEKY